MTPTRTPPSEIDFFETAAAEAIGRLPSPGRFVAGVSGGADSCALLSALARLRSRFSFSLRCVHVVHGLRSVEEGAADEAHVRSLCRLLSVPCTVARVPRGAIAVRARSSGKGIEDAARHFRHRAFRAAARRMGADRILIGHTADDLLETVLMRVLRGAGPAGLAPLPEDSGTIARPLLRRSRADVLRYLEALSLAYREDPSNADPRYLRNRVRHSLVPLLDAEFGGWRSALRSLSGTQGLVARCLSEEAAGRIPWKAVGEGNGDALETTLETFLGANEAVRAEALFQAVDRVAASRRARFAGPDAAPRGERVPSRKTVEGFAAGATGAACLGPARVVAEGGAVRVEPMRRSRRNWGLSLALDAVGEFRIRDVRARLAAEAAPEAVAVRLPAVVRTPFPFERSALRAGLQGFAAGTLLAYVVEDSDGYACAVSIDASGGVKLHSFDRKASVSGYADMRFFSIL